ncbi:hypothetical protein, partial [Hyella patelloides]|uniref:hypothetical protein n=1 Tax=Hyella patelloides TaxID=1982969 RepID=UPI001C946715
HKQLNKIANRSSFWHGGLGNSQVGRENRKIIRRQNLHLGEVRSIFGRLYFLTNLCRVIYSELLKYKLEKINWLWLQNLSILGQ